MSKFKTLLRKQLYMPLAEKAAGRKIQEKIVLLQGWNNDAASEKKQRTATALVNTLRYAAIHVPYYRDLFRRIKFDPERVVQDMAWFSEVPHLTKEIVMMQPERFLSDEFDRSALIERKTSGSTGLTLSFFYSRSELDLASAVLRFLDLATGKTPGDSEVYLRLTSSENPEMVLRERMAEVFKELTLNRRTLDISGMNAEEAQRCLKMLRTQRPYSIYGLRSTFESLLRLAGDAVNGKGLCKTYLSTGETLDRRSAEFIAAQVGCKVFNRYGNAEFGAVAQSEDDTQVMRFVDGLVLPESFTVEGFSEIVLTTLNGRAMPLIRYRTGDLGNVAADSNGSFYLSNVMGRLHDIINVGEHNYSTAYFSEFLQRRFEVHDFQIIEGHAETPLEFRVVTDRPEQLEQIAAVLSQHLGQQVKVVRIRLSDLIRRGRQMKFTHVIRGSAQ